MPQPVFEGKGRLQPGPCLTARCLSSSSPLHLLAASPLQHCCISSAAIVSSPLHRCNSSATLPPATLQLFCRNRLFSSALLPLLFSSSHSDESCQASSSGHAASVPRCGSQSCWAIYADGAFPLLPEIFIAENGSLLLKTGAYY